MNKETPGYVMEVMRQRTGLNASDTSEDEKLLALSPREKLYKVCGLVFGRSIMGGQFFKMGK